LRLTLLSINGFNSHASPDTLSENKSSIGLGFNIGFEKRKHINDKSSFYYGLDLLTSYNSSVTDDIQDQIRFENTSSSVGLGLVLGWIYNISKDISLAADMIPSINYNYNKSTNIISSSNITSGSTTKLTTKGFIYGLSNSGVN